MQSLIFTPLLPAVQPQSCTLTLPQTSLVQDSIWRPANKRQNIQFTAILDVLRKIQFLLRCTKDFNKENELIMQSTERLLTMFLPMPTSFIAVGCLPSCTRAFTLLLYFFSFPRKENVLQKQYFKRKKTNY